MYSHHASFYHKTGKISNSLMPLFQQFQQLSNNILFCACARVPFMFIVHTLCTTCVMNSCQICETEIRDKMSRG